MRCRYGNVYFFEIFNFRYIITKMKKYIIGIDEVGRGSIAGPVTVVALAMPVGFKVRVKNMKLKDSKKLSAKNRERWFDYIKNNPEVFYSLAHVQPSIIDKINISQSANLAATRALSRLIAIGKIKSSVKKIYLDGGLYIIDQSLNNKHKPQTVIRGDEKIKAVSLASIVAKVTRDNLMSRLHKKYPKYGFNVHKGYGTKMHMDAVKRYGPSKKHRVTFL